ncbi:hypothetical protein M885DRAFT_286901 [Pelagophyceae sp. CCMP2097]|nr:hypothetical protein M885DRAFT_286901 [Pelagophyceae sp. CCMP2097]
MWFCKALAGLGAVGVQAGNKVNLAYDNVGVPPLAAGAERRTNYRHTTTLLETHYFPEKNGTVPFAQSEFNFFEELWATLPTIQKRRGEAVASPFKHIGVQRTFEDLQPFNNLIFAGSLAAAQRTFGDRVVKRDSNVYTLDLEAVVPADRVGEAQHSDASPQCGDWACVVACVAGRHALEIGGPTLLFVKRNFEVYPHLASAHNLNLYSLADSFQTIKASPLNKVFSERFSALADVGREYELLMTSHAIEHFANPLRLLSDFAAKLVPHGLILSFVPNHVEFWDKTRPLTTFDHLLADFANDMQEDDLTHIDENLATDHPYKRNPHHPDIAPGLTYANMLWANIEYRTMHHHTFDIDLVVQMHEHLGFETIAAFTPANDKLQLIYLGRRKW